MRRWQREGGVRERERQRGRRRERQRRERGNEEGQRNYGRETGRVARRSGVRKLGSEERRWMRKKERGRKREVGKIEKVHTENVGGKESETEKQLEKSKMGKG